MYCLTTESIKIISNFIDKNINNYKYDISKLYNNLEKYYKQSYDYLIISNKQIKNKKYNEISSNKYISENIINSIYKLKHSKEIKIKYKEIIITIIINYNDNNIDKIIKNLITYILYMYSISNYKNNIKFTYYLTSLKKMYTEDKELTSNNVNTGLSKPGEIIIWRKEEYLKTTIHECIHQMGLDYHINENMLIKKYNLKYNNNSETINSYEGYTDFWAVIINTYLIIKLCNLNILNFIKYINIERYFILHQANVVLKIYKNKKNKDYNKNTNVLAYYIIKGELFKNIDKTLKILNYNIIIDNFNKYYNYLLNIDKITYKNTIKKNINKTMRMSALEIK